MKKFLAVIIGGLIIGFIGYYFGQNTALAVVGGWVLANPIKD